MANSKFFVQVDPSAFRRFLNSSGHAKIRQTGFETVIYADKGDVLGIVHAASIDEKGRCHPTQYYLTRSSYVAPKSVLPMRLVA